jgi:hypothetical protein
MLKEIKEVNFRRNFILFRKKTYHEEMIWKNRKRKIWKKEIVDNNENLEVNCEAFMLKNKHKIDFRGSLDKITHIVNCIQLIGWKGGRIYGHFFLDRICHGKHIHKTLVKKVQG